MQASRPEQLQGAAETRLVNTEKKAKKGGGGRGGEKKKRRKMYIMQSKSGKSALTALSSLLLGKRPRGGTFTQVQSLKAHAELRGSRCHVKTSLRSAATPERWRHPQALPTQAGSPCPAVLFHGSDPANSAVSPPPVTGMAGVAGEQVPDTAEGHNPNYKHGVFLKSIKKRFNLKKGKKKKKNEP